MAKKGKARKKTTERNGRICQNPNCFKAGQLQANGHFYKSRVFGIDRHPVCKTCIAQLIDIKNMETVYSVLMSMDIAFIKKYWDISLERSPENPFGKYITMLNSMHTFDNKRWRDSVFETVEKKEEEIEEIKEETQKTEQEEQNVIEITKENELNHEEIEEDENLKKIKSVKWGGEFTQEELDYLNEYYEGLNKDFRIVTTNHKDYAKKISKISLEMDKALNEMANGGDNKTYKELSSVFDSLCKSAKFSENQRGINDVSLGSFGVIAEKIENHEWIPSYEPVEKDTYDLLIEQFSNIDKSL